MESKFPVWPYYEKKQINSALEVLRSGKVNYWTGNKCIAFENEFLVNVDIISIHRPNLLLNNNKKIFGINQTYRMNTLKI